jgi:hypothetical protein
MILRSPLQPSIGTRSSAVPWQMQLTGAGVRDAINNPVAYGETLGPELVSNGGFDSGTGWTLGTGWSIGGGVASFAAGVDNSDAYTTLGATTAGRTYLIALNLTYVSGGALRVIYGSQGVTLSAATGAYSFRLVTLGAGDTFLRLRALIGASVFTVDNISVREVLFGYLLPGLGGARLNASARSSVAMQQKADGSYEYAAHNLLTNSADFSNAAWGKNVSTFAANRLTATGANEASLNQLVATFSVGTVLAVSVRASLVTSGVHLYVRNICVNDGVPSGVATFNLETGAVLYTGSAYSSATITPVGNGQYDCTVVGTKIGATAAPRIDIGLTTSTTGGTGCTVGNAVDIWRAQLNLGPTATAYVPTTAAAVYAPAVDWLSAQSAYGLRSEAAATNLVLYNADMSNAAWQVFSTGATKVGSATALGAVPMYRVNVGSAGGAFSGASAVFQTSLTIAAATTYTVSVLARSVSGTVPFRIGMDSSPGVNTGTDCIATTTPQLFTHTVTTPAGSPHVGNISIRAATAGGVVGDIEVGGFQLETGSRASSRILTLAATATRAADLLIVPDTGAGLVGQAQGTIAVAAVAGIVGNLGVVSINDGSAADRVDIRSDGTTTVTLASTALSSPTVATMVAGTLAKTSMSYSLRAAAASRAGSLPVPVGDAPGFTQLQIGGIDGGTTANLNGWITSLQIAQTSSLPASLQGMTA